MILKAKARKDFNNWRIEKNYGTDHVRHNSIVVRSLIVEWLDSVGYPISVTPRFDGENGWIFIVCVYDINLKEYCHHTTFKNRKDATDHAISMVSGIYNNLQQ